MQLCDGIHGNELRNKYATELLHSFVNSYNMPDKAYAFAVLCTLHMNIRINEMKMKTGIKMMMRCE